MRSYTVASASFVLNAPLKWLDNVLSRHSVPGVQQLVPGADRRVSAEAMDRLQIVRSFNVDLGIAVPAALVLAERVLADPNHCLSLGPGLELRLSHAVLRGELEARAAESSVAQQRRRGRPPAKS